MNLFLLNFDLKKNFFHKVRGGYGKRSSGRDACAPEAGDHPDSDGKPADRAEYWLF